MELNKAHAVAEHGLNKSVQDARIEVAKGAVARAQKGAEAVRNVAAAIGPSVRESLDSHSQPRTPGCPRRESSRPSF